MQMVDGLAQRYGQHPDDIIGRDTYVFRLVSTLDAYGLLTHAPKQPEQNDDDPEGLAGMMETLGG